METVLPNSKEENLDNKSDLIFRAKMAEQAERYEELMKKITKYDTPLSIEERNLFSVAYKNVVGNRRASWRIISSIEAKELAKENLLKVEVIKKYKTKIEGELQNICNEVVDLIDRNLLPTEFNDEAKLFYAKMQVSLHKKKGDYYRYLSEFTTGNERKQYSQKSSSAYDEASKLTNNLPATHPIRLGMALSWAVFQYEILGSPEKAIQLAKTAFDDAIAELDTIPEEEYKDVTLIMQLLRDNLTLWTSDEVTDGGES